jgi:hypothetical protein
MIKFIAEIKMNTKSEIFRGDIMKKLFALTLALQQICYGSQTNESINRLYKCIHKTQYQNVLENVQAITFKDLKAINFGKHLIAHFPEEEIQDLVIATAYSKPKEIQQAEDEFHQASENFYQSKNFPKVDPTGKSLQEYIQQLKNIQN